MLVRSVVGTGQTGKLTNSKPIVRVAYFLSECDQTEPPSSDRSRRFFSENGIRSGKPEGSKVLCNRVSLLAPSETMESNTGCIAKRTK